MNVALALASVGLLAVAAVGRAMRADDTASASAHIAASPQFNGKKFDNGVPMNPDLTTARGVLSMLTEWVTSGAQREPATTPPVDRLTSGDFARPVTDGIKVWWLGHSTLLIEIDGVRILTDPVWSERASMFSWAGPKRYFAPLIALEDLPDIDAVLISHDHYDHLDKATIKRLAQISDTPFFVPLGVGAHLRGWGIADDRVTELDWWEETTVGGVTLAATPARHMSGRGLFDQNATLWASWALVGPKHRVYFGGDSGLTEAFEQIGDRYGPFDLTMLDTGQYGKWWPDVHMGPEQAVIAQKALRGKLLLPIHWGLFTLATHSWTEPAERMRVAAREGGIAIVQPRPGQPVALSSPLQNPEDYATPWWPTDVDWQDADTRKIQSTHVDPAWIERMRARRTPRTAP
ncbi:MAG: MBL fold metallo-hydrolase [Candidatus Dadabacteria bacterium]|nr:MAG: MBL fold metallo-hydrolase [Candidatus Dadabacteria bacterium]